MTSVNREFYRIEPANTAWIAGKQITVGKNDNPFARNWKNSETKYTFPATGKQDWVNLQLESYYNTLIGIPNAPASLSNLAELQDFLKCILKASNDSILSSRELVFEVVRQKEFSDLPSRMKCMFLIPQDSKSILYWWKQLKTQGGGKRKLFRISFEGVCHRASARDLVPLKTCSINRWYGYAR